MTILTYILITIGNFILVFYLVDKIYRGKEKKRIAYLESVLQQYSKKEEEFKVFEKRIKAISNQNECALMGVKEQSVNLFLSYDAFRMQIEKYYNKMDNIEEVNLIYQENLNNLRKLNLFFRDSFKMDIPEYISRHTAKQQGTNFSVN
jgi:hypothetical protein